MNESEYIAKAVKNLGICNQFRLGERVLTIACLLRDNDRRPLRAPWWRKKESYIIAADIDGNFFLRHCDGSVRYWDHKLQSDCIVAASVSEFISKIEM